MENRVNAGMQPRRQPQLNRDRAVHSNNLERAKVLAAQLVALGNRPYWQRQMFKTKR